MARGFLSKQWLHTIHPSRNPTRTMNKLQWLIWMEFFEPLWKNRNKLLHRTVNFFTQANDDKLAESIILYCKNRHLAHHATHLANNIDLSSLQSMPLKQKQEWVQHFKGAKEAHKRERRLAETKQKSIQEYMISTKKMPTQPRQIHTISPLQVSPRRRRIWVTHQQHPYQHKPQRQLGTPLSPKQSPKKDPPHYHHDHPSHVRALRSAGNACELHRQ